MLNFSDTIKGSNLIVKIRMPHDYEVNADLFQRLTEDNICGFFVPKECHKRHIELVGPIGISLKRKLSSEITAFDFFCFVLQILCVRKRIESENLNPELCLWEAQKVFLNNNTKELHFIYLPIKSFPNENNMKSLLDEVIYSAKLTSDNIDELVMFKSFLNKKGTYDIASIEEYIYNKHPDIVEIFDHEFIAKKNEASAFEQEKRKYDLEQNFLRESSMSVKSMIITEKPEKTEDSTDEKDTYFDKTVSFHDLAKKKTGISEIELLQSLDFYSYDDSLSRAPILFRDSTNEEIIIDKSVFKIGKEKRVVDYCVLDNKTVSRHHADIVKRENNYYIVDQNSTNKTLINGKAIKPMEEHQLFDGDIITMSNEMFTFSFQK